MYVPQTVTGVTVVGVRKSAGDRFVGRASGFSDTDPTGTAALDPTRAQMRAATRRATTLILRAEDELAEAGSVIANGYLRLDREEWIRVVEKRSAALAPAVSIAPRIAPPAHEGDAMGRHEPH